MIYHFRFFTTFRKNLNQFFKSSNFSTQLPHLILEFLLVIFTVRRVTLSRIVCVTISGIVRLTISSIFCNSELKESLSLRLELRVSPPRDSSTSSMIVFSPILNFSCSFQSFAASSDLNPFHADLNPLIRSLKTSRITHYMIMIIQIIQIVSFIIHFSFFISFIFHFHFSFTILIPDQHHQILISFVQIMQILIPFIQILILSLHSLHPNHPDFYFTLSRSYFTSSRSSTLLTVRTLKSSVTKV